MAVLGGRDALVAEQRHAAVFTLERAQTFENVAASVNFGAIRSLELWPRQSLMGVGAQQVDARRGILQPHVHA